MGRTRLITLNGNGGPMTAIQSSQVSRRVRVREDEANNSTGLQYQKPDDSFTNTYTVGTVGPPDQPQIDLGDQASMGYRATILGFPVQNSAGAFNFRAADTYTKAQGKTAGATTVRVVEDD